MGQGMTSKEACGSCGAQGGCGCQKPDPYEESFHHVWHDPTSYDPVKHGPSYLKLGSDHKALVRASLKGSAYYDTGQQYARSNMEPLSTLLAVLRAASHIHQTHHWQTRGGHYYADHLLFERLYNESQQFIDEVAERAVGSGGEALVDARLQVNLLAAMVNSSYPVRTPAPEEMVVVSLGAEQMVLGVVQAILNRMETENTLSPGTSNLLEGLSDKHEQFTYLLGQRHKTASAYSYDRR